MKSFLGILVLFFAIVAKAEFKNSSEAGILITSGNTKTDSLNLKNSALYNFDLNKLKFDASYLRSKQKGVLSAESWYLGLRYERELSNKWSLFVAQSAEGDAFAGILQRYNSDLGGKYYIYKLEKNFNWFAEAGYRYTREHTTSEAHTKQQKARAYSEAEKHWSEATSSKFWVEYIPNFTDSQAWLLNGEASISSALSSVFAIKSAYLVKFSNKPASSTAVKTDKVFTTSLVANF